MHNCAMKRYCGSAALPGYRCLNTERNLTLSPSRSVTVIMSMETAAFSDIEVTVYFTIYSLAAVINLVY